MTDDPVTTGYEALAEGRWADARAAFEFALAVAESPDATFGLASALWWLGDSHAGIRVAAEAYTLFRRVGDVPGAIRCAVWLTILYKSDFGNYPAANGWACRAERLLTGLDQGPLHGWVRLARAYLMTDLATAETLTREAVRLGRDGGDADLELSALAQLGKIMVGRGQVADGFALIDEAMAAALAGESPTLDTVVYASCDMLAACELVDDLERAEQWCQVADEFVARYGCPFLHAECRIYYGSVLVAKGRWADAERELTNGISVTTGVSPGLHARALTRLASLRIRQGRLEEAETLLATIEPHVEVESTLGRAALQLARGDAPAASRTLEHGLQLLREHRAYLGAALDLLVDAYLELGDPAAAERIVDDLFEVASAAECAGLDALAVGARGRVSAAAGDVEASVADLRAALAIWSRLGQPFESARVHHSIGHALAVGMAGAGPEATVTTGVTDSSATDSVATDYLRQALAEFRALGAMLEADRVAAELRALGVPAGPGARSDDVLTVREQQVLRLVAAGLSNPEIAARLHVSRKTAAHHVSHILAKLNLRNRAEAVAYATAGPPPGPLPHAQG